MVDAEKLAGLLANVLVHARGWAQPVEERAKLSIEAHGDGEAIYVGRSNTAHGLNVAHVTEPAYQWPDVRALIVESVNELPAMLGELEEWRSGAAAIGILATATPHKSLCDVFFGMEEHHRAHHEAEAKLLLERNEAQAHSDDANRLVGKLGDILTRTANALKGPPDELMLHSWHDLSETADRYVKAIDAAIAELHEHREDGCAGPGGTARQGACSMCAIAARLQEVRRG